MYTEKSHNLFEGATSFALCVAWVIGSCKLTWEMTAVVSEKCLPCPGSTNGNAHIRSKFMCLGGFLTVVFNGLMFNGLNV